MPGSVASGTHCINTTRNYRYKFITIRTVNVVHFFLLVTASNFSKSSRHALKQKGLPVQWAPVDLR